MFGGHEGEMFCVGPVSNSGAWKPIGLGRDGVEGIEEVLGDGSAEP